MAVPLRTAMHSEVLCTRQEFSVGTDAQVFAVVAYALQTTHHSKSHLARQIRIFTVCFLSASPPRVAEDVYVRGPERQTLVALYLACPLSLQSLHTSLVADSRKDLVQQHIVPRCRHSHSYRENSCHTVAPYAVKSLVPPVKLRHSQAFYRRRVIHHETYFLVYRQSAKQIVGPLSCRQRRILIRQHLSINNANTEACRY